MNSLSNSLSREEIKNKFLLDSEIFKQRMTKHSKRGDEVEKFRQFSTMLKIDKTFPGRSGSKLDEGVHEIAPKIQEGSSILRNYEMDLLKSSVPKEDKRLGNSVSGSTDGNKLNDKVDDKKIGNTDEKKTKGDSPMPLIGATSSVALFAIGVFAAAYIAAVLMTGFSLLGVSVALLLGGIAVGGGTTILYFTCIRR